MFDFGLATIFVGYTTILHGSLNVPIFHIIQPLDSISYMVY